VSAIAQPDLFVQQEARAPGGMPARGCRCEMCRPGEPAPTYTEGFRHECEARYVAAMPSNDSRAEYLGKVHDARGDVEYFRLRSAAWREIQRAGAST
jgi:hypothetical protein